MKYKSVKIRTERTCPACDRVHAKGSLMKLAEWRDPKYDQWGFQDGIEYVKVWMCEDVDACNERILATYD
ncbi:hypothetical protein MLD52_09080 [Puniceicoccaceae bacterium K14]|nr:hypothetical protein [Puniceicoccaceae bacterium K14]